MAKITIKYKDYDSHRRVRLMIDDRFAGSLLLTKAEFDVLTATLEKGCAAVNHTLQLIEIQANFQVSDAGPADDATIGGLRARPPDPED